MTRLQLTLRILKPLGFLAALGPAAWLVWHALGDGDLGADPVKTIQVTTGLATLILLFVTLGITPLRRLLHWSELIRLRRMAGLFAFFYATLHALTYFVFDQSLDPGLIWADTVKHPRIAVGFVAFLMLIPLALTSTDRSIRRLGKRWGRLHRLIYPATALSGRIGSDNAKQEFYLTDAVASLRRRGKRVALGAVAPPDLPGDRPERAPLPDGPEAGSQGGVRVRGGLRRAHGPAAAAVAPAAAAGPRGGLSRRAGVPRSLIFPP